MANIAVPQHLTALAGAVLVLFAAACTTDKERIADQNEAARSPVPATRTKFGNVSVFDLRLGDCLASYPGAVAGDRGDLVGARNVEVVGCNTIEASVRVKKLHLIDDGPEIRFYGEDAMIDLAEDVCLTSRDSYYFFVPLRESWEEGYRTITCIEPVGREYAEGDCLAGPQYEHRVIDCGLDEVFAEVTRIVDLSREYSPLGGVPAESEFNTIFVEECDDADFYLYPTRIGWDDGDRDFICAKTR